jgi:hypothetical protein
MARNLMLNHLFMVQVDVSITDKVFEYLGGRSVPIQLTLPFTDGIRNSILIYFFCNKAETESMVQELQSFGILRNDIACVPLALVKEADPPQGLSLAEDSPLMDAENAEKKKPGALSEFYSTIKARIAVENMLGRFQFSSRNTQQCQNVLY